MNTYGKCDICGKKDVAVTRKDYQYDIKCICCRGIDGKHFEAIRYCKDCVPKPPARIMIWQSIEMKPIKKESQ